MPGTALSSLYGLTTVTKYPGKKSRSPSLWTIFKFESDIYSSSCLSFLVYCHYLLRNSPGRGRGMQSGLKKHTKTKSLFVCSVMVHQMEVKTDEEVKWFYGLNVGWRQGEWGVCQAAKPGGAKRQPGPRAPPRPCHLRLHPCLPGPASGDDALARKMPDRFLSTPTFFPSLNWTIAM